jgi:hypothetical protein
MRGHLILTPPLKYRPIRKHLHPSWSQMLILNFSKLLITRKLKTKRDKTTSSRIKTIRVKINLRVELTLILMTKISDCKNILKESTSSHLLAAEEVNSRVEEVALNRCTNKKSVKSSL